MKIIYIVNARIPTEKAHGYQICKMCEVFASFGIKVKLVVPTRINPIKENAFSFYELKKNFKINYIKSFDFLKFVKYLGRLSFYLQSLLFFIKLLFKKIDKDVIIYTRNPEVVWLFKLRGFKVSYECHSWFSKKRKKIVLFFLKKCDYIITTNSYKKQKLMKNRFNRKKILVAPNGVDMKTFDINIGKGNAIKKLRLKKETENKLLNNKVLVYTGSFKTNGIRKGIEEILKALKILKKENIYFVAIGGSEKDIKYYENIAKNLEVREKVRFFPRKSHTELALFQKAADVLLMPFPRKAHYEYLMSPIKMFEYMASKRPIIASNLPSIREVLTEENAILIEPDNPESLAKGIEKALKNPDFSAKISKQVYQDVQKYTWQKRAEKIINFINKE